MNWKMILAVCLLLPLMSFAQVTPAQPSPTSSSEGLGAVQVEVIAQPPVNPLPSALVPQPRNAIAWWKQRFEAKAAQRLAIAQKGGELPLVMIGDSITHGWEKPGIYFYNLLQHRYGEVLNLGYSGDCTEHVLWRLDNGELDGLKPAVVTLMIGTNNVRVSEPEDVVEGIRRILEKVRIQAPNARILLHPIFPRNATAADPLREKNEKVNALIRPFANGKEIIWVDFNAAMLDLNGDLSKVVMPDLLHPNSIGYAAWYQAIAPHLPPRLR